MTSKTYSISGSEQFRHIFGWSLKKNWGLSALFGALSILFFIFPVFDYAQLSRSSSDSGIQSYYISYTQQMLTKTVLPLTLLFTVTLCCLLFSYMHKKNNLDLYGSLPVGRIPLFLGKYFAGITLISLPLLVVLCIIIPIKSIWGLSEPNCQILVQNILWILLAAIANFTFFTLFAVCSGTTMDMILSVIIISAAWPAVMVAGSGFIEILLAGAPLTITIIPVYITALSPLGAAFIPLIRQTGPSFPVWWIILTVVLFFLSMILCRSRKNDYVGGRFAFSFPVVIIRFLVSAGAGMGIGYLLGMLFHRYAFFYIGMVIGSLVAHIVVEAIYSRGLKNLKKSLLYYGAFLVLFLGVYISVSTGFFGYDTYVPNPSDVASVHISKLDYNTYTSHEINDINPSTQFVVPRNPSLNGQDAIKLVTQLHKSLIDAYRQRYGYPYSQGILSKSFDIFYFMKDGTEIKRSYPYYYGELVNYVSQPYVNDLLNLPEYKEQTNALFAIKPQDVQFIDLWTKSPFSGSTAHEIENIRKTPKVITPTDTVKQELMDALKQDILNETTAQRDRTNKEAAAKEGIFLSLVPQGNNYTVTMYPNGKFQIGNNAFADAQEYCIPEHYTNTRAVIEKYEWLK